MPLTEAPSFAFPHDVDLHLLREQPAPTLQTLLFVTWRTGPGPTDTTDGTFDQYPQPASGPDVILDFKPVFLCQTTPQSYSGFGVTIDRTTGAMTIGAWPANQIAPANFIVEVSVRLNGTQMNPPLTKAVLRVHLHRSVKQVWMTPPRLSIRRPAPTGDVDTGYSFTVRAQFDDDTVGDITGTANYAPAPADAAFFNNDRNVRIPAAMAPGAVRTIGIVTTVAWGNLPAHADIAVLEPFETATDLPQVSLIDGRTGLWDGTLKPENVPNVLFLGAGFRALDQTGWEQMTDTIVHRFRTDRRLHPYGYLSNSINYWRMLAPAGDSGVCVRCEMYPIKNDNGDLSAASVPSPEAPPATGAWEVKHLVYMAGLPIPADLALVQPDAEDPDILDYSLLDHKLNVIVAPNPPRILTPDIVGGWLKLARRTFIDEVDNFPSIAIGEVPSAHFDDTGLITYHPLRGGPLLAGGANAERVGLYTHVNAAPRNGIVTTLDDSGTNTPQLGNLWGQNRPGFVFDNRQFVVTIGNLAVNSDAHFGRSEYIEDDGVLTRPTVDFIADNIQRNGVPVTAAASRNALLLAPPLLAELKILPETWDVIAHEMGHAFGLGDEYGAEPTPVNFGEGVLVQVPNLMTYRAAIKADQSTPDPKIIVDQLKWTWHRVRKASVLTRPVEEMFDGTFRVFVGKGRGFQFLAGDAVRFRVRKPRESIPPNPVTSIEEFVVVSTHAENLSDATDLFSMTVVVKNEAIGLDVSPFVAGCIIYLPVPSPSPTFVRPYLTLVPPVSERIMEAIGGPMGGTSCDVNATEVNKAKVQIPRLPLDQLKAFAPLLDVPDLVGAYYGGAQHACGILHPAGSCIMRSGRADYARFCPVCQYAMVEKLDPEQHWQVDQAIDKYYQL